MLLSRADQESLHRYSIRHRPAVERSTLCGCFYCESRFPPTEISDWVDLSPEAPPDATEDE